MAAGFVHLHLHSEYSLLDGGNRIDKLVARIKDLGMEAVALTDHGNLFGAVAFYTACKDQGIKPILGIEAYVAPDVAGADGDRRDRSFRGVADGGFHLVLLAENNTGWQHLLKLSSDAYLEGFYFRPRMDKSTLTQWADGLIAINGHLGSSIAYHLTQYNRSKDPAHYKRAREEALWHQQTFGCNDKGEPRFYLETQSHGVPEQEAINPHIRKLASELNIPVVCDNDAHFMTADDWDAHDTLICVSTGKIKDSEDRMRYPKDLYVKSPAQMQQLFKDHPEELAHTVAIARRCEVELDFDANHAPVVRLERHADRASTDAPHGSTEWYKAFCSQFELLPYDSATDTETPAQLKQQCDDILRELCEAGMVWRYGDQVSDEHRARLERELQILADKLISAYFLIVWDFVNEARRRGIPANARGSGVGTMVGYVLGLSNACPVEYGLLFERFTDPNRNEYPDIDIDMCQDGRQEIIEYVREKYGYVAQIITFGTMKARAAIRDVGRVHSLPLGDVDKLCKLIGDGLGVTLDKALAQEPDLKKLYDEQPHIRSVIDTARRLEGISRHSGVHAAGVVLATQPLDNIVPLATSKQGQKTITLTQWDGPTCERVGLLKMDFLGLRTLSIIEKARQFILDSFDMDTIKRTIRPEGDWEEDWDPLDLERLPTDDQNVFDLYRRAETAGTFQFESDGMRGMLLQMKPDRLEDLIAGNALFRPGPMALIDDYCDRKHGRKPVPLVHPIVDKFTAPTYGIMVYQEQVMQIVHELGGIPLRDAYSLIKAISKKKEKLINAARAEFIVGAGTRGLEKSKADELFDLILKFAGYGFNKSHSAGYSIVAYTTAWLKTYFPVQYMAAVLTYECGDTDKVVKYIDECKRVLRRNAARGVEVRPPDINLSHVGFSVVYHKGEPRDTDHGHIRFGLSAVKGVGEKAIRAIIAAREKGGVFKSLYDFCERVPLGSVNRATIEALIKAGAFDSVHSTDRRAAMVEALDGAIQAGHRAAADRDSGQMSIFGALGGGGGGTATAAAPTVETRLPDIEPWATAEQLSYEKSVVGFYLSSHPMDEHRKTLEAFSNASVADVQHLRGETEVILGVMVQRVKTAITRKGRSAGQKMAMLTFEDPTGKIDGVAFAETYAVASPLLVQDNIVFLRGKVDRKREEPNIMVNEVISLQDAPARLTMTVKIVLRDDSRGDDPPLRLNGELSNLKSVLKQSQHRRGGSMADVLIEVHQRDMVAQVRLDGLRIGVEHDLPQRIATILHSDSDCCELIGPPRLRRALQPAEMLDDQDGPRLRRPGTDHEDVCDSIDRY